MDISTTAQVHGILSVALGVLFAWLVYRFGIRGRSTNRWMYGFRNTLWGALIGAFQLGGGISRLILGIPDSPYGMSLEQRLLGGLGIYAIAALVLFPVGVDRGDKELEKLAARPRSNEEL